MEFVQLLADDCGGLGPIVNFIKNGVFPIIQIGIPILLIIMGSIDLGKAVLSSDDKEIKGASGRLIKRIIYAVAIFFVVTIVSLVFSALGSNGKDKVGEGEDAGKHAKDWFECWENS